MSSELLSAELAVPYFPAVAGLAAQLRDGRTGPGPFLERVLDRIHERDGYWRAFTRFRPETVRRRLADVEALTGDLPLYGVPVGVKDLIDTADEETEYGSVLHAGHRPTQDAEVVRKLRAAGAVIAGKTVTTEFALFQPPATRNPHHPGRTPGGSSSGSAAAVAAGLVPVALGTQTAGSVLRPASYCGVLGFKPGFAVIDRAGVRELARSFDTLGLFGRRVEDLRTVFRAISDAPESAEPDGRPLRIAVGSGGDWRALEDGTEAVLRNVGQRLVAAGCEVRESELDGLLSSLADEQEVLMGFEAHRTLGPEFQTRPDGLSPRLRSYLEASAVISSERAIDAMVRISRWQSEWEERTRGLDAVVVPSAFGEAPAATSTGDPRLCRAGTALGIPAISLPLGTGPDGLPIGVQLLGRRLQDHHLLDVAARVMEVFDGGPRPA
ncbi:amidase [Arthrobacter woluwensis]|uniref:amidase n=1 Tax=Arthrobacter woluwensis TaxID=156980 RepID=UPI003829353D